MTTEITKLPSILELRNDTTLAIRSEENLLNAFLNEEPEPKWILLNKYAGNSKYIPVARLEWLMTKTFVRWYTEVLSVNLIANSVAVTVRVHYLHPITAEWCWTDGVGASRIQVNEGSAATDFGSMKANAIEMGLPKAKTEAIKDAIGDLGRLFGRDLNRKDAPDYAELLGEFPITLEQIERLQNLIVESGADETAFLKNFMCVEKLGTILQSDFKKAENALLQKKKGKK
jgi:hypothetical protein